MANRRKSVWVVAVALCLLVAVICGWWRLRHAPRWNVLFITLDTTRADRLGCYGYKKALTPTLDQLASDGVLFEHAYAPVPLTLPSHASMFTGLYPPEHGLRVNGREALPPELPTLATILAERGYSTSAFVSAFPLDRKFGLQRGFQVYNDELNDVKLDEGRQLRDAVNVTDAALSWLEKNDNSRFLCWVHYYDVHHPYLDHAAEFGERFKTDPYDAEIAYVDRQIKRLRDFLEVRGLLENTLIVVVGDHGESLGEHQERRHGDMVYNSTLHVPMFFRFPQELKVVRHIPGAVSLVDLLPTVLDTLGLPPVERISGVSLASQIRGDVQPAPTGGPGVRSIYAESLEPQVFHGWSPLRSLIYGNWKYIRTRQPELFDLEKDSDELRNLATLEPERIAEMEERLIALEKGFVHWAASPAKLSTGDIGKLSAIGYAFTPSRQEGDQRSPSAGRDIKEMIVLANKSDEAEDVAYADPKRAEALAREVLTIDSNFEAAWVALGHALLNQRKVSEAQKALLKALEIDPGAYMANFYLGNICLEKQDLAQAVARYELALKYRPDASGFHANLGNALLLQGRVDSAVRHLQTAVELHPAGMSSRLSLAGALTQTGQVDAAIAEIQFVLKHSPDSADAHGQLGMLLFRKQQVKEGIVHLRRSVQLNPSDALMHYNLAVALEGIGLLEEAIKEFEQSLKLNPADTVTKKSLEEARLKRRMP